MAINSRTLDLLASMRRGVDVQVDATTRALTAQWSQAWHEIADEWLIAAQAIVGLENPSPDRILKLNRTQRALNAASERLAALSDEFEAMMREPLDQVMKHTADVSEQLVRSQLPGADHGVGLSFTRVSPEALDWIVDRTMANITSSRMPLAADAVVAMKSSLLRAVPAGWGPERAAREMLRRTRSSFNGGLSRALTIARTEMLDAHRAASRASDMANDMVQQWQWMANLDAHVCPSCAAMHGRRFDKDVEGPHDHPNGRCARLPVTVSWADLGFPDLDEPPDDFETTEDWMKRAPHEAVSALGPERVLMLNDGTIDLEDMTQYRDNDEWRGSYQATPLNDLRKKASQ